MADGLFIGHLAVKSSLVVDQSISYGHVRLSESVIQKLEHATLVG